MHRKRVLVAAILAAAALVGFGSAVLVPTVEQDTVVLADSSVPAGYANGWGVNRGW